VLFALPKITKEIRSQLTELDRLRQRLGAQSGVATPWLGRLSRQLQASSIESSISIEGFHVPEDQAARLLAGAEPVDPADENLMALTSYARAMDHVGAMAIDTAFHWSERVILDLHFDACHFQRDRTPGRWRTGPIGVTRPGGGGLAYRGPDAEEVPALMNEVAQWLERGDPDAHVVLRAAMAHLHLVSVHPFRDGNGRVARIVQSLVLARDGLLTPELGSIEEYLGRNTPTYYSLLAETQGGRYQPRRDATAWVAFCVRAHLEQAQHRISQLTEAGARWAHLESVIEQRGWPDRLVIALEQSLFHGTDRLSYAAEAEVSPATASADLRRLLDAGLLVQRGRGRATRYVAADALRAGVRKATGDA
jgi:Fic family protein